MHWIDRMLTCRIVVSLIIKIGVMLGKECWGGEVGYERRWDEMVGGRLTVYNPVNGVVMDCDSYVP